MRTLYRIQSMKLLIISVCVLLSMFCTNDVLSAVSSESKQSKKPVYENGRFFASTGYGFTQLLPSVYVEFGYKTRFISPAIRGGYGIVSVWLEMELAVRDVFKEGVSVYVTYGKYGVVQVGSFLYWGVGVEFNRKGDEYMRFEVTEFDQQTDMVGREDTSDDTDIYPRLMFGRRF